MMEHLVILWTNNNKEVFANMIAMYAINAIKEDWWKHVTLIIWGPSAKLASDDTQIQTEIMEMIQAGIKVEACKACADIYQISAKLEKIGIEVKYMGELFTAHLKNNTKLLTF
jgi:hypothetical protein